MEIIACKNPARNYHKLKYDTTDPSHTLDIIFIKSTLEIR